MNDAPAASTLSESDRRLVHALQIVPRASWTDLGRVLGSDPVTVSRRWARLKSSGISWVTAYPASSGRSLALVELECQPGLTLDVAARLVQDREAQIVDLTAGGRDILVTISCRNHEELGDYVLEKMSALESLRGMRTHLLTGIHKDASAWQLRALAPGEVVELQRLAAARQGRSRRTVVQSEDEAAIVAELARDGRATAAELASRLSMNVDRTRASLNSVLESGRVVVRTEVARTHSGRPAYAWYFLQTPARSVDLVMDKLSALNDVRLIAPTIGPFNIVMAMWLRTIGDIQKLEMVIEANVPEVRIVDRSLVLRTPKHLGRILTTSGTSTGAMTEIPLWA